MVETVRVTVVIPTYNWSSVLPYSIGSVLDQTFADFELLVIGDGCTDDSAEVVAAIPDPRVQWVNLQRTGHQSGPNNEGLRRARGELIAYLGHDDLWLPHHLAIAVTAIDAGADLTHSLVVAVGTDGATSAMAAAGPGEWIPPTCVVHRRQVTDTVGPWRHHRGLTVPPELELWQRAASAGFRCSAIPRLTAVKFPAAWRRDVYRERPCHEQARWLDRIRTEPDLEVTELARLVRHPGSHLRPSGEAMRRLVPRPVRRAIRRVQGRLPRDASVAEVQRFKGVTSDDHSA